MYEDSTLMLLFLEAATILLTNEVRKQVHRFVSLLELRLFLLEMLATFQFCACFNILAPLANVEPIPQLYLAHIYSFSTFHFYLTLSENTSNPASTLVYILRRGVSLRLGGLKIVAQFIGGFLARIYRSYLWLAGVSSLLADPYTCSKPLQTYLLKAFFTELITSITFQFTLLQSQFQEPRVRANMLSLTITSLVYAGLLAKTFLFKRRLQLYCFILLLFIYCCKPPQGFGEWGGIEAF
uniref:Uncharacterized protein n=1 Tax=Varanus komodoensis TaxID=61221 RepID=A0A8D2J6H9_VARKO